MEAEQFVQDSLAQEERDLKEKGEVKHVSTFRQALPQVRAVVVTQTSIKYFKHFVYLF